MGRRDEQVRSRSLQRNAADPTQVKFAERKARQQEELFGAGLRQVLDTEAGRVVLWGLLERAGIYRSIWDPSAKIHYNAGRQDFGHELLALIVEASPENYLQMEAEARRRAAFTAREAAAVQQATEPQEQQ